MSTNMVASQVHMPGWAARIGAICYAVWALLHFRASYEVFKLADGMNPSAARGRLYQDAFFLLCCAAVSLIVALALNWRNSSLGYWLNLAIIAVADIGFILFIVVPGYSPFWPGMEGPIAWILGWAFTTYALIAARSLNPLPQIPDNAAI